MGILRVTAAEREHRVGQAGVLGPHPDHDRSVVPPLDHEAGGFCWLDANDWENSIFVFERSEPDGGRCYVIVNATPVPREGYRMGVAEAGFYKELLNSDSSAYGGSNVGNGAGCSAESVPWQGLPWSVQVTVPPLATVILARA
jgi:1,4-alpha-glucan branching enzyme